MKTKHTPGPWEVTQQADNAVYAVIKISDFYVLTMDDNSFDPEEENANAKLIAAAPELLDALQTLMSRYKSLVDSGDCGFWEEEEEPEYIKAQEAINKATL